MINKGRLEKAILEHEYVVFHPYGDNSYLLLYTGDEEHMATNRFFSYSGKTEIYKKGMRLSIR